MAASEDKPTRFHMDLDADRDVRTCIHCGLCLSSCPTYRELGTEMDSPRGRIYLIRAMHEERLVPDGLDGMNSEAVEHLDLCLGCRACESVCPSGVKYGRILENARTEIARVRRAHDVTLSGLPKFMMQTVIPSRRWLDNAASLVRLAKTCGLEALTARIGPEPYRSLAAKSPDLIGRPFTSSAQRLYPAEGERRGRVAFFTGCVMDALMGDIHRDTVRVLTAQGVEVLVAPSQTCCGALHIHAGDEDRAHQLARQNLDALQALQFDAFVNNSAGCGAQIRDWGHLLRHDPDYADLAAQIAAKTVDISRYLVNLGLRPPPHPVPLKVAYDAPCHLHHAQRETSAPLQMLRAVPDLDVVELDGSDACCGAAGLYTLTQPEMAARIFAPKVAALKRQKPDVLATGNPGCIMQFQQGIRHAGLDIAVMHPIQLLARAYVAPA